MNKRIKELAKEHLVRDEHTEFGWQECHKYVFDPEELSKFAELIVRECTDICKDTAEKQFNPLFSRESDGADVCSRKIKEHFGVTE